MQHRFILLLFCVISSTLLRPAYADTTVPERLTVKDAVQIAIQNNVKLKQAELSRLDTISNLHKASILTTYGVTANTGMKQYSEKETPTSINGQESSTASYLRKTDMSGQISSTASFISPFGPTASLSTSPFALGNGSGSVALEMDYPLTQGKGILARKYNELLNARNAVGLQNKSLHNSQQSTILSIINAYFGAVLSRDNVTIEENALKQAQDMAEFTQRKVDAGMEPGIYVTQQEVGVMRAKERLNDVQQKARSSVDSLMLVMGVEVGQIPDLVDDVPDYDPQLPPVDDAIRTALENRIEVAQLKENLSQQQRDLAITNDRMRAGIGMTARWSSSALDAGLDSGESYIGMKATIPLDKRALQEDSNIASRAVEHAQKERDYQEEQIANEIRGNYRDVDKARTSLKNLGESEKSINLQVYQAKRMLEEGLGTSIDLVNAQDQLAAFNVQYKSARVNLYLAHLRLKLAMGEDVLVVGAK